MSPHDRDPQRSRPCRAPVSKAISSRSPATSPRLWPLQADETPEPRMQNHIIKSTSSSHNLANPSLPPERQE